MIWAQRHGISAAAMWELQNLFNPSTPVNGDGLSEAHAQGAIRLAAPFNGSLLWRNNSGATKDETGRLVRYGLGNDSERINKQWKSSDLIGLTTVVIQPSHIGQAFGIFTAIEVKAPGWKKPGNERERAQAAYLTIVNARGGIGRFATSVGDIWPAKSV